jgi:UPF0755 protein
MKALLSRLLTLLVALALVAGAAGWKGMQLLDEPLHLPDPGGRLLWIKPGEGLRQAAVKLKAEGVLDWPEVWLAYAWITGAARRVQAGEYRLLPGMSARQLLDALVQGRAVQHSFTLVEGWTFRQLRQQLARLEPLVLALDGRPDAEVMQALGRGGSHPEGRFAPDTFFYQRGQRDVDLLSRAFEQQAVRLAHAWEQRQPGLPLQSADEALILASLVEKETGLAKERPDIAGVFIRRLQLGMRLQTDPAVIYGLGEAFDGNLRRADLQTDTPYNTYTRSGLPPTPIAMPGRAALLAAVRPASGKALYFVARGDGSHQFSATLDEHNRAVARFQLKR